MWNESKTRLTAQHHSTACRRCVTGNRVRATTLVIAKRSGRTDYELSGKNRHQNSSLKKKQTCYFMSLVVLCFIRHYLSHTWRDLMFCHVIFHKNGCDVKYREFSVRCLEWLNVAIVTTSALASCMEGNFSSFLQIENLKIHTYLTFLTYCLKLRKILL